jgi:hypothetical protein
MLRFAPFIRPPSLVDHIQDRLIHFGIAPVDTAECYPRPAESMERQMRVILLSSPSLALLSALMIAGCGKDDVAGDDTGGGDDTGVTADDSGEPADDTDNTGGDDTDPVQGDYSLSITSPSDGATVSSPVTMTLDVGDFSLDPDSMGSAHVEGYGHVHIYLDGTYLEAIGTSSYTFSDLTEGGHTLGAVLAQNDHVEYADTYQEVSVEVASAGDPLVIITSPKYGSTTTGSSVELGLLFQNFEVVEPGGGTVDGQGHYHIYVDGTYVTYDDNPDSTLIGRLTPGDHTISVVLADNNHVEFSPAINDNIEITVPDDGPAIMLVEPSNTNLSAEVDSASWPVTVAVDNFFLVDDLGGTGVEGEGHYHIYVDGTYVTATADLSTWLLHQDGGTHDLMVALALSDHSEIGVYDWIRVTTPEGRPDITITSPPSGEFVSTTFTGSVSVENFTLDPDSFGGANVDGEGHYHVFIDDLYLGASGESTFTATNVIPGERVLRVGLFNNDHSERNPPVYDEVTITVQ